MTKETSQILKGVAILLMIYLHLFNKMSNVELCDTWIDIRGVPLVHLLTNLCCPVPIFLILSGYGLFKAWQKGDKNRWGRIIKLMIHYWVILIVFVCVGHFIKPDQYPGSFYKIILNFTGFDPSYNSELWFLFPYLMVSIISPYLFKISSRFRWYWVIGITLLIYVGTLFIMTRTIETLPLNVKWNLKILLNIPLFLFNFSLGMVAARSHLYEKITSKIKIKKTLYSTLAWIGIIAVAGLNFIFKYNFFYAFILISLLNFVAFPSLIKTTLIKLGNQSMNMWMIHSWFCFHLFHDFIYSIKYPILIFIALTIISYCLSLVFNLLCEPFENRILTKREIKEKPIL